MKRLLLLTMSCLLMGSAIAQTFSKDLWHDGEADLFSGETVRGKIKYDLDNNSLQVSTGGIVRSFSAYQVEAFQIFDDLQKTPRYFYTLPYKKTGNYDSPMFFELLYEGIRLSLLNRETFQQRVIGTPGMWGWGWWGPRMGMGTTIVQVDSYYVLDMTKEQVIKPGDQRADWLLLMKDFRDEIGEFMRANKLSVTERKDLLKIMTYYDELVKKSAGK
ncbi:MAG: hypothetical protein RMJ87_01320 [Cytophagales bacterium]|nr:hypothetical protein [Bernardetiaceae bacterium]MDW8203641.1 hypothetical protein [Cytophagales bacterium]